MKKRPIKPASNKDKTILSLFDYSGTWSAPYRKAGYNVIQADIKRGIDVFEVMEDVMLQVAEYPGSTVYGVLAAPPCTDFSASGALHWKEKETQPAKYHSYRTRLEFKNTTELSIYLVLATLEIIEQLKPKFYAIENPVGRMAKLIPEIGEPWYFQPWEYGDPWTKKTGIWGKFNKPIKTPVLPVVHKCKTRKAAGEWISEKTGKKVVFISLDKWLDLTL